MLAFGLNLICFAIIGECSALGYNLLGCSKDAVVVALSALLYREAVSTLEWCAYPLPVAGQLLWAQRKLDDREIDEDARVLASKAADEDESDEEDESLRNPIVAQRYGSTAPPSPAF